MTRHDKIDRNQTPRKSASKSFVRKAKSFAACCCATRNPGKGPLRGMWHACGGGGGPHICGGMSVMKRWQSSLGGGTATVYRTSCPFHGRECKTWEETEKYYFNRRHWVPLTTLFQRHHKPPYRPWWPSPSSPSACSDEHEKTLAGNVKNSWSSHTYPNWACILRMPCAFVSGETAPHTPLTWEGGTLYLDLVCCDDKEFSVTARDMRCLVMVISRHCLARNNLSSATLLQLPSHMLSGR